MSITSGSTLRLGGALAGLALVASGLLVTAGPASAKTGTDGYEYVCMADDIDAGCRENIKGAGWDPNIGTYGGSGASTTGSGDPAVAGDFGWSSGAAHFGQEEVEADGVTINHRWYTNDGSQASWDLADDLQRSHNYQWCMPEADTVLCN